jgi:penicillin amidase
VLVIIVAVAAWFIRSPLPKLNGTLSVFGLYSPVTIRRDDRGIPHIRAQSESDALFAEGFACAQDRLWQMDFFRRIAEGKLSEVMGPTTLSVDRYMRTLGLNAAAQHDAARLRGQALRDVQAYADGVNAAAASRPLPIEFRLLGYRPHPWVPSDSIAIIKLMAQRLDDQFDLIELRTIIAHKIGVHAAAALLDVQAPRYEHFVQPASAVALAESPGDELARPNGRNGSNEWVLSGSRVTTGRPVLSNDTHLEHAVPSYYWLVQLTSPTLNVEGFIVPGIPFVALGHNERIAFGVTSGGVAAQDVYVERFKSAASDEYLANGRWLRARHRIERIAVKGGKLETLDVLVTRHGPVVKRNGTAGFALAWPILTAGSEIELLRKLDFASSWAQFEAALTQIVGPVFNWAYADVDGNIGYHLAGRIPNRLRGDGSFPVEGQDDRYAWHGFIPFDRLPYAYNPRQGFVATANNELDSPRTQIGSSPFFDAPYRIDRIYRRIRAGDMMNPQQIGEIQLDTIDEARRTLAAITVQNLRGSRNPLLQRVASDLARWDGTIDATSAIPTFLVAEQEALIDELLKPKLGDVLVARYVHYYESVVPFERVWRGDQSLRSIGITQASLRAALPAAVLRAAREVGVTADEGFSHGTPWGQKNEAVFDHPLGRFWPLDALLNVKKFPQQGDGLTVYAAKPEHGPASRLVTDLSNWDNSSMLVTLGESGQFNSPHYQDQVQDFRSARWVATPFSDAAVQAATRDTLILKPK